MNKNEMKIGKFSQIFKESDKNNLRICTPKYHITFICWIFII